HGRVHPAGAGGRLLHAHPHVAVARGREAAGTRRRGRAVMRRAAILAGVPVLLAVLVAVPLGLWRGPYQWLCAAVALGLTVTPGVATLVLAERLGKASAYGRVVALVLGTVVRLAVGFGGAALVFF